MSIFPNLCAVKLETTLTALELFERCQSEPYALFLDSASTTHEDAHYDFIFRAPECVIRSKNEQLTVSANSIAQLPKAPTHAAQMFDYAEQLMALTGHYNGPEHLPFQGGFAGAVGYDFGRCLEVIPEFNRDEYNSSDAVLAYYCEAVIFDKKRNEVWLVAPEQALKTQKAYWEQSPQSDSNTPFKLASAWRSNMSEAEYHTKFNAVQAYLLSGDAYQINLAQRYQASYQGCEWAAYKKLRASNNAPFSAFMRTPESAILSVSPERFLSTTGAGEVQTKPIKGTRPRYEDSSRDSASKQALLNSEKDRAENLMIVDLLRNDLSKNCEPGSVKTPKLFAIESFPAVHHLVSTITGQLKMGGSALRLFKGAFPGGSITGAPKIRAMQIIEELEPNRRGIYCGSIGYFSQHGQSDSSITIRTLLAENGQLYCWAGGGLVADSKADEEYQETKDKVSRILPVLTS
ncbi:aminodeoxychorismate synthase component I [Idiomarina sp. WRN-38]|uniref:aminodeoxychorismate synthase component I n=1 Tax=Idiomarina sp. OXR-189 TaxID=3100175 RepID=UPI0007338740|nr:aminodeoxychorismate synthase component I [Idiomarina sp. OXR-189]KTG23322.1 aminodeoxychorismate synthase component I [Idiomarina sp. H105]OAE90715.1 aminodeoxychorismate synthase component I [Idiomarina sp. WRN-38]WPZ00530.1 aminodeoxychorismate synthase component I [Idiomarina sp. OXR-189]